MQLKDIAAKLFELWNLMDTSKEERNTFSSITSILGSSESEITDRGALSTEMIEKVSTSFPSFFFLFFHSLPFNLEMKMIKIEMSFCRHQQKWIG